MHASQYAVKDIPISTRTGQTPSGFIEYGFYFYMSYTLLGGVFGLFVNNLASGILVLLLMLCLTELGSQALSMIRVGAFPLACGITYAFIQLVLHEESLTHAVRPFLLWMMTLVLIQSLALRKSFLHRFAVVMFLIGLAALPYLSFYQTGKYQAAGLDRAIGFGQINAMGEWYGFCALYFVVVACTTRKNALRILVLAIAVGCLYVVTLTVSRGALLAITIGIVVATRHLLKRGFLPVLLVACIGAIVVALGVFDQSIQSYNTRGAEDTGRLAAWPLIIDSFLNSPLIGVGHSNIGATPAGGHFVSPHNGFLYMAQSSGVVPLALFIAYWLRSGWAAKQADVAKSPDAEFYLPLLAFSFVTSNLSGATFMTFWAIVSLAVPMTTTGQGQALDIRGQLNRGVRTARFEIAK
jgi:O-antigen ligase